MYLQEHKADKELKELMLNQEKVVSGLSDREKRALAAERRMVTQVPGSATVLRYSDCHPAHSLFSLPFPAPFLFFLIQSWSVQFL